MPDWTYQTILRPLLFGLPADQAREVTLAAMGTLGDLPLGGAVIDLMGHMRPPERAKVSVMGMEFPSRVGLGAGLDVNGRAVNALARFGFGFLEFGPVSEKAVVAADGVERLTDELAIRYPAVMGNRGVEALWRRLERANTLGVPVGVRLAHQPDPIQSAHERKRLIGQLSPFRVIAPYAQFFTLDGADWNADQWREHLGIVREAYDGALVIALTPDQDDQAVIGIVRAGIECGISGVMIGGGTLKGAPIREASLAKVRLLRGEFPDLPIIASGGIIEPKHALTFLEAGAALIQIHSGLVYSGPGLPKRINEAVMYGEIAPPSTAGLRETRGVNPPESESDRSLLRRIPAWMWAGALGAGLTISAMVVGIVALTRIVLPYDEAFVGLTREQLDAINPRLLPFMAHDRVTVAGTMLSTGILYLGLARGGIRRGQHWAQMAFNASAISGFPNILLFLGFGYFDPLHAILTLGLLPLFLISLVARRMPPVDAAPPNLVNSERWRLAQWGQLMFVLIGVGLLIAGTAITSVGVTSVFVKEDLAFMQTTASALREANDRLVPLVAHDRAGFGGNLISVGLAVLLLALWGFRQGHRWVWWTMAVGGTAGFIAAIGIHLAVGYTDLWHLFPAIVALGLFGFGLLFSYPYLMRGSR